MLWLSIARLMTEFKLHIFTGRREKLLATENFCIKSRTVVSRLPVGCGGYPNDKGLN
jgi:hypothetical protein